VRDAGDDRLALGGDRDQLRAREPAVVQSVERDGGAGGTGGRGAEPGRRADPLSMWIRAGASSASTTAPTVFFLGSSGMYCAPTPVTSIVVSAAFSTVTTSAGRVRAAPNTSNPLPRFALVAGARTVTMAGSVARGAKEAGSNNGAVRRNGDAVGNRQNETETAENREFVVRTALPAGHRPQ